MAQRFTFGTATNLGGIATPTLDQDAANKKYVDDNTNVISPDSTIVVTNNLTSTGIDIDLVRETARIDENIAFKIGSATLRTRMSGGDSETNVVISQAPSAPVTMTVATATDSAVILATLNGLGGRATTISTVVQDGSILLVESYSALPLQIVATFPMTTTLAQVEALFSGIRSDQVFYGGPTTGTFVFQPRPKMAIADQFRAGANITLMRDGDNNVTINGVADTGTIVYAGTDSPNTTNPANSKVGDLYEQYDLAIPTKIIAQFYKTVSTPTTNTWLLYTGTNTLTNPTNTITSTVNGIVATAPAVNTVVNTTTAGGVLTTTVNGIASMPLALPGSVTYFGIETNPNTRTDFGKIGDFYLHVDALIQPTFVIEAWIRADRTTNPWIIEQTVNALVSPNGTLTIANSMTGNTTLDLAQQGATGGQVLTWDATLTTPKFVPKTTTVALAQGTVFGRLKATVNGVDSNDFLLPVVGAVTFSGLGSPNANNPLGSKLGDLYEQIDVSPNPTKIVAQWYKSTSENTSWISLTDTAGVYIQDEGVAVAATNTLNFTGAGVTASGSSAGVTINVPGLTVQGQKPDVVTFDDGFAYTYTPVNKTLTVDVALAAQKAGAAITGPYSTINLGTNLNGTIANNIFTINATGGGGGVTTSAVVWGANSSGSTVKNAYSSPGVINSQPVTITFSPTSDLGPVTAATVTIGGAMVTGTYTTTDTFPAPFSFTIPTTAMTDAIQLNGGAVVVTATYNTVATIFMPGTLTVAQAVPATQPTLNIATTNPPSESVFFPAGTGTITATAVPAAGTTLSGVMYTATPPTGPAVTNATGIFPMVPLGSTMVAISAGTVSGSAGGPVNQPITTPAQNRTVTQQTFTPAYWTTTADSTQPTFSTASTNPNQTASDPTGQTIGIPAGNLGTNYAWVITTKPIANVFLVLRFGPTPLVPDVTYTIQETPAAGGTPITYNLFGITSLDPNATIRIMFT